MSASIDLRQVYLNAVLGGMGGLLGWAVQVMVEGATGEWSAYVRQAVIGPLLGVSIGFFIGAADGIVTARSAKRAWRGGLVGAGLGAAGGFVGLVLGELVFNLLGGGVYLRALGWALFGGFVGASDGLAQKMPDKVRYGILGGILGGLVGGATFDGLRILLSSLDRSVGLAWGSAIGTIIVGAAIGAFIRLVESILRKAWVRFIRGRLEGQTRTLDSSRPFTLGRAGHCSIVIPEDATIAPVHAEIFFQEDHVIVRPREGKVIVSRNEKEVEIKVALKLLTGDRIQIGESKMVFRREEVKKS